MFSTIFIKRPRFAFVISLVIMLAGVASYFTLPVAEYPQVTPPVIVVGTFYPGASAQVIADTVAAPLETAINGVEGLTYFESKSDNSGNYTLTITFDTGVNEDMALTNVNNAVKMAESNLPSEVKTNLFSYKRSSDILGVIALQSSNPEHDLMYISNYASINITDNLSRLKGVGQSFVFSDRTYSMRVWLDPLKLRGFNMSIGEIANAIQTQNVQAAAGSVGTDSSNPYMSFKVDTQGRLKTPQEFQNIIVRTGADGRQILLRDVARVEMGSEKYTGQTLYNGGPAAIVGVFKMNDANALTVMTKVREEMDRLAKDFPEGMEWVMGYDSTRFVKVSMKEIAMTLIMTFILVVVITYAFLPSWRATVIPSATIPVSLIGTLLFLKIFHMSINTLSMFALILVIGSVVDNAICVTENCMRLIDEEGLSPYDAAVRCMKEISNALIASTLVVLAVYVPIAFYGGMVGIIYTQFAVTMCTALVLSTVNALTLSPALCAMLLRKTKPAWGPFKIFNWTVNTTRNGFVSVSSLLVRHVFVTLILFAGILAGNFLLYGRIAPAFLPSEDKGALFAEVILPPGASLPRTSEVLHDMLDRIKDVKGIRNSLLIPGQSMTAGNGENCGFVIFELDSWELRKTPDLQLSAIQAEMTRRVADIADARIMILAPPPINGMGASGGVTFAFQAKGEKTPQQLSAAAEELCAKIMQTGKAVYAFSSFDANTPMLNIDIDRAKAEALRLSPSTIFYTLQAFFGSMYINDFNRFSKTYKVNVQADFQFRKNLNYMKQIYIPSSTGAQVPFDAIATLNWTQGSRQAERFNMFPSASINTQSVPFFSSGQMMTLVSDIMHDFGQDYGISWTGMSYQESQNQGKIIWILGMALLMAYLFLVAQYESWTLPISVILSVGTATLGGLVALFVTRGDMNIYCQLGLLMLIGLTAKSAILMVEYAKQERESGLSIREAAVRGMRIRFRSVMMTALSFVFGVLPLLYATGAGAASRHAVGVTTFWGMSVAAIVGMTFIPGLYVVFQYIGEFFLNMFHGKKIESN